MLKLLKKYIPSILIIIILLIIQAMADLKLPEYTANIINVGIQNKGITSSIPNVISKTTLDNIVAISNDTSIYNSYNLITKDNHPEYSIDDDIYELKENINEDELKNKLLVPMTFYSMLLSSDKTKNINLNKETITMMMNNKEVSEMYKKVSELDFSMLDNYAKVLTVNELEKIGLNLDYIQMHYLLSTGGKMLLLSFIIMIVIIASTYVSTYVSTSYAYDLRDAVVSKVMNFSTAEYNDFSQSSLITRSTNDISQLQMFLGMFLKMVLYAPIIGMGAIVKVWGQPLAWIIALAVGLILILISILLIFALPKFKKIQKLVDKVNLVVREQLNGLPVIRAFANENFEIKKFDLVNLDLTKISLFTSRLMSIMSPGMTIIMNVVLIMIYWFGAKSIDTGVMQVGDLTAFANYNMQIIMAFLMLSMLAIMLPRAIISIRRIKEVLDKKVSITSPEHPKKFDSSHQGEIEFNHVSFKYPDGDEEVLHDINFKINKGETVAIIGATGSGKTSIINLIPRLFDITSGSIIVDGVDVRDASLKELREKIGLVPQKSFLFSGTISSNIKFVDPTMSDNIMKKSSEIACANEFIEDLDEKYDYPISQGGTNVSGGQRQRICIARAIAKNPEIYIFDDSFSALDYKTDSLVRHNLKEYCKDATKIIVAQRVSTVMHADKIIVLDKGSIVGIGTHKYLYKNNKLYKEIALSQLKEEELA